MATKKHTWSIITLNINGLNAIIKRHRWPNGYKTKIIYICCLLDAHFRCKDRCKLKMKGWKKIFCEKGNQKKAEVVIVI